MDVQLKRQDGYGVATAPGNASPATYGMSQLNTQAKGLLQQQITVMIFCRAKPDCALTVVDLDKRVTLDGHVELAPANAMNNVKQQWIKDDHWGVAIKDYEGRPAFAIVNPVTREAIQHTYSTPTPIYPGVVGGHSPVRLVPYNPIVPDKSVLWTEEEAGQGFCYIRELKEVINPHLVGVRQDPKVLDVDPKLKDGKEWIVMSTRNGDLTQHWKIQRGVL